MKYRTNRAVLSLILILTTPIHADTWQIGLLAENGRSPFIGDRQETSTLPTVNYIGERFSYMGGKLEYRLSPTGGSHGYIVGQMRQRQFYSANQGLALEGMQERDSAFELGVGTKIHTTWGQFVLEGLLDMTDSHEGFELSAQHSYPKQMGRWLIEPAIGLQMQSSNLVDFYHGVKDEEAQVDRPAYKGEHAVNKIISLMVGYTFNAQLLAIAGLERIVLDTSIANSPIVGEKNNQKVFVGIIYTF